MKKFTTASRRASVITFALLTMSLLVTVRDARAAGDSAGHEAISRYIATQSQNGVFSIFDTRGEKPLALKLLSIHSTAHPMKSGEVFYCADFKGSDGTEYDLDFYVNEKAPTPSVVEVFVHKAAGADRIRPAKEAKATDESTAKKVHEAIAHAWAKPMAVTDTRSGQELTLTFDHTHKSVKTLPDGSYFACVDARDSEGVLYDLDTYVRPSGAGYKVLETLIHKRDGVERLR